MSIIFLGAPGSGKGTQSEIIEKSFGYKKLSTGDILRNEVNNSTNLGKEVKAIIEKGELVSDNLMISIIETTLELSNYENGFILDGFPRTLNQAISLTEMLEKKFITLKAVIELSVDKDLLIDRVVNRYTCAVCKAGYNFKSNLTKIKNTCDNCNSTNFIQRSDDSVETLLSRLEIHYIQMKQLKPYYQSKNIFHTIDGMKNVNEVTNEINIILNS